MALIRVLIADDHEMIREGIRSWLNAETDIEVVESISKGEDIIGGVHSHMPDVLLLDLHFPTIHGLDIIRTLRKDGNLTPILVMTGYERQRAKAVLEAGANGFLSKDESKERIIEAVRWAAQREQGVWLSPSAAQEALQADKAIAEADLTRTELSVLSLIELSNSQIAEKLYLSEGTVKNHISNIYAKLGVHERREALSWAHKHGILESKGNR